MATVTARVTSEVASAMTLTSWSLLLLADAPSGAGRLGTSPITSAPASGIAPATVSQGKLLIGSAASSALDPHQQQGAHQQHGADEHGQRVGADEPGLHPAQPPGRPAHG